MPELPEVEVTRQGLANRIAGARVLSARLGKPLRWPLGCSPADLAGRVVQGVRRRGKYLLLDLDAGGVLLLHLGMSGSLQFAARHPAPGVHDHFDLVTTRGTLRLHDPRRFGAVVYAHTEDAPVARKLLGRLGMEPLSGSSTSGRSDAAHARQAAIKQVLLAGDLVVGVGNIYACEALFLSAIRPTTAAARIGPVRAARLHAAIRDVLARAVAKGGSTLRDFSGADGQAGYFQLEATVYGRAGEPCKVCGASIKSLRQGQRSSFFCPKCQRN